MNIIFLDFDGVINNRTSLTNGQNIDITCLELLESALCHIKDVKIVVTSSWRTIGIDFIRKRFSQVNKESFIDSYFHENWSTICSPNQKRGDVVEEWISRHPDVEKYVCIDDDSDYLEHQKLIQTDRIIGFTYIDQAILLSLFRKPTEKETKNILSMISNIDRIQERRRKLIKEIQS